MKKVTSVFQYELPVNVVHDADGMLATCPDWLDCYAQGDTIDEAISEITAVAASLIKLYQEERKSIPLKLKSESNLLSKFRLDVPLIVSA